MVMGMGKIRVLLADRSGIFVKGLAKVLESEADIEIVATCSALEECVSKITEFKPDILIWGTNIRTKLDRNKRIETSLHTYKAVPNLQFIMLTESENEDQFLLGLQVGARSYLSKYVSEQYLLSTIRRVYAGEVIISSAMAQKVLKEFTILKDREDVVRKKEDFALTERETEILKLVAAGKGNKEVAATLFISENTVKRHMSNIFQKLQVRSRQQAALILLDKGITLTNQT